MGLKEELQKIIDAERQNLGDEDVAQDEYSANKKRQFSVLGKLLRELSNELDPQYGEISVSDDFATIVLARKEGKGEEETQITVEPDYDTSLGEGSFLGKFINVDGFRLEQEDFYQYPEYNTFEKTEKFPTEEAVMEYLLKEIGEKIAYFQHIEKG